MKPLNVCFGDSADIYQNLFYQRARIYLEAIEEGEIFCLLYYSILFDSSVVCACV